MPGALENILVLDLSRYLPGPYCSMLLADHGARVVRIENRRFEKENLAFLNHVNRNKQHMSLNLKTDSGKNVFLELARRAHVVLEGFRPGVMDRLGVGYERIKEVNPEIIYCALTGYGQSGPLKDTAGHDMNFVAQSGVMSLVGQREGGPLIPGVQLGDLTGGLNAAIAILLALFSKEKTGRGQYIDISMTDSLMGLLPLAAGWLWQHGRPPSRGDFMFSHRYAFYNVYAASDGKYLALGALEPRFWSRVCEYFHVPHYVPLQYDENRRLEIIGFFRKAFLGKTRDEWVDIFSKLDVCLSPVMDIDEALESDHARERKMVIGEDEMTDEGYVGLGFPVKLSRTTASYRSAPASFGEHTEEILTELGHSGDQIEKMKKDNVI